MNMDTVHIQYFLQSKNILRLGGALVKWLCEETHVVKVESLNLSTVYCIVTLFCSKNCYVCLKRQKINET